MTCKWTNNQITDSGGRFIFKVLPFLVHKIREVWVTECVTDRLPLLNYQLLVIVNDL